MNQHCTRFNTVALIAFIALSPCLLGAEPAPRVVHVFVALCDNANQGIVPVRAALGNGQDPENNLYWGAMYGVDTFLKRSDKWKTMTDVPRSAGKMILRRSIFKLTDADESVYLVADAYDGAHMKQALAEFFAATAGDLSALIQFKDGSRAITLGAGGDSDLICFVGHNGLMEHRFQNLPVSASTRPRAAIVLACKSRDYFSEPLKRAGCKAVITTASLMAPEAYVLDAAVRSWLAGDAAQTTRRRTAEAYAQYQKISLASAERIFVAE